MHSAFLLNVSHAQIAVFDSTLAQPFNLWTDRHVRQGFAWRPGSVAFMTISDGGVHLVEVIVAPEASLTPPDAERIIQVPFAVPAAGIVEIASISDAKPMRLPLGKYTLTFENLRRPADQEPKVTLRFSPCDEATFKILRADSALSPTSDLLLTASPA